MARIEKAKDEFKDAPMPPVIRVQLLRDKVGSRTELDRPEDVAQVPCHYLGHEDREHFAAVLLDAENRIIGIHTVGIGILNATMVCPREAFKAAILANAVSVIVGHNHPSGDPTPSPEGIEVTQTLKEAGKGFGIEVLDHIIVGEEEAWTSIGTLGPL